MLLDSGICSIFSARDVAEPGNLPIKRFDLLHQSWYGELDYETGPAAQTAWREDVEASTRIRVHQCRAINNRDVVVLFQTNALPDDTAERFEITRAFHGTDEANGQDITDLTLRRLYG